MFIKRALLALTLSVLTFIALPLPSVIAVDVINPVCQNVQGGDVPAICRDNTKPGDDFLFGPDGVITKIINIFSVVLGVAAVIVIMISAIRFISSNGDPATISSARSAIIFAIIGLVVAAVSQAVVQLVLSKI